MPAWYEMQPWFIGIEDYYDNDSLSQPAAAMSLASFSAYPTPPLPLASGRWHGILGCQAQEILAQIQSPG
jgi:hypothetical protein